MKKVIATLKSCSPYSQSRHHSEPKLEKESPKDYELRTWRYRLHTDKNGNVYIPRGVRRMLKALETDDFEVVRK